MHGASDHAQIRRLEEFTDRFLDGLGKNAPVDGGLSTASGKHGKKKPRIGLSDDSNGGTQQCDTNLATGKKKEKKGGKSGDL